MNFLTEKHPEIHSRKEKNNERSIPFHGKTLNGIFPS